MIRVLNLPEWHVAIFAFLLNFFWEVQQMPLFQLASLSCQDRVFNCTLATVGDVGIALLSFWTVAAVHRSRYWIVRPNRGQVTIFIAVGVAITITFEALATSVLDRWEYASTMPTLPLLGTGLSPLLQWILIPPLILGFSKRQLV